jgi:hypothetical protein
VTTVARRKEGLDRESYVAESLRVWKADPTLTLGELHARRPHYYAIVRRLIDEQGLEHELITFAARRDRGLRS